jgi:hypothetical protein
MNANSALAIGKIVKSNTHIDYVCQVFCRGECDPLPQPGDYALGTFVSIALEEVLPFGGLGGGGSGTGARRLIGVIYNTLLLNPDFGSLGPRLSQRSDLEIFSPDYLSETATLVGVITVGWQTETGAYHQGVPALAATVNNVVHRLDDGDLHAFHTNGSAHGTVHGTADGTAHGEANGRICLHYVPVLLSTQSPIVPPLLLNIVDRLRLLFPDQQRPLAVMRNNLAWKSIVEPAG